MKLDHGLHLAYCTNIHRGETWEETWSALKQHTLSVRDRVCPRAPFAIGLRLGHDAALELARPEALDAFRQWLDQENCYVFTINGFPYGRFHGTRVKEQVYRPDWTTPERLEYTKRLFDILAALLPDDVDEGSVSTLPGSFKEFNIDAEGARCIRENLWACVDHQAALAERTGKQLHLGLEPEPLGWFENTPETLRFFEGWKALRPHAEAEHQLLGVNYDTCHLAVEYEDPFDSLLAFEDAGVRISKLHLSNALQVRPDGPMHARLRAFADDVYLHQVIARTRAGDLRYFRDLEPALTSGNLDEEEWRIHFHVPLHFSGDDRLQTTHAHLLGVLDTLARRPALCRHLEMETYTWEVLPEPMKNRSVEEQLAGEYKWTLGALQARGIRPQI